MCSWPLLNWPKGDFFLALSNLYWVPIRGFYFATDKFLFINRETYNTRIIVGNINNVINQKQTFAGDAKGGK